MLSLHWCSRFCWNLCSHLLLCSSDILDRETCVSVFLFISTRWHSLLNLAALIIINSLLDKIRLFPQTLKFQRSATHCSLWPLCTCCHLPLQTPSWSLAIHPPTTKGQSANMRTSLLSLALLCRDPDESGPRGFTARPDSLMLFEADVVSVLTKHLWCQRKKNTQEVIKKETFFLRGT